MEAQARAANELLIARTDTRERSAGHPTTHPRMGTACRQQRPPAAAHPLPRAVQHANLAERQPLLCGRGHAARRLAWPGWAPPLASRSRIATHEQATMLPLRERALQRPRRRCRRIAPASLRMPAAAVGG